MISVQEMHRLRRARRWRYWAIWIGILLLGPPLIAWYNQAPALNGKVERIHSSLTPGTALPDFVITDFEGTTLRLSQLRGKPVLLDFWASWCPPCRISMPELVRMQARYRDRVTVLAVNLMDGRPAARTFIDNHDYPLRYVTADSLARFLGIQVLPTKVLLDGEGKILWAGVGHIPVATHLMLERYL